MGGTALPASKLNTALDEIARPTFNVLAYGARGDNATDDSGAIQAAINAAYDAGGGTVFLPPTGKPYKINTGLTVPNGVWLEGRGHNFYGPTVSAEQWGGKGSWLRSTDLANPAVTLSGVGTGVRNLSFIYDQPTPSGGSWTPILYPWTIRITQNFVTVEKILIVAGTHGIIWDYDSAHGGGTFCQARELYLAVFNEGLQTHNVNDTMTIHGVNIRNMWYVTDTRVVAYINANLVGWRVKYTDNVRASAIECFQARTMFLFENSTVAAGAFNLTHASSYCQFSNILSNLCAALIDCATGTTVVRAQFQNVVHESDITTGASAGYAINLACDNVHVQFSNLWIPFVGNGVLTLGAGGGGRVMINGLRVDTYSGNTAGAYCINLAANAQLLIPGGLREVVGAVGAGYVIHGVGSGEHLTGGGYLVPVQMPQYWINQLPAAAAYPYGLVGLLDGASNKRVAFSDGTTWRYADGTAV